MKRMLAATVLAVGCLGLLGCNYHGGFSYLKGHGGHGGHGHYTSYKHHGHHGHRGHRGHHGHRGGHRGHHGPAYCY